MHSALFVLIENIISFYITEKNTNMITFWCKIMVLQMLITAITHSTKLEFDDGPKLSNKNIIWLFNKFLEVVLNSIII